jgi:putative IMPACT (imprinted ancient) family translation regulator
VGERPNVYDWVKLREPFEEIEAGTRGVVVAYSAHYERALVQFTGVDEPRHVPVEALEML